jgi:hypothetical protein
MRDPSIVSKYTIAYTCIGTPDRICQLALIQSSDRSDFRSFQYAKAGFTILDIGYL